MGKISQETRLHNYYKIFEQIHEISTISINDIAENTGLSRNTVSKYLKEMYNLNIIMGPHLRVNPHANYKEYVYLMNFSDPWLVFKGLNQFPHVLYHSITFGDWNTMVVTDNLLDFSRLKSFQTIVYQGVRGYSYTPKPEFTAWDECFKHLNEHITQYVPVPVHKNKKLLAPLPWGEDEWKLFHSFKYNVRKKVTPLLRTINVRYESYLKWAATLEAHSTVHTGFYPDGYTTYLSCCFLVSGCQSTVKSLFSHFPTTPFIMEINSNVLVFITMPSLETRKLFCTLYHMKINQIIEGFSHAVALFYCQH